MRQYSIGKRLMQDYLNQPCSWVLSRNSAELGKSILAEVTTIIGNGMTPIMDIIAKGTVTFALLVLITIADPKMALMTGLTLSIFYGIIYKFTRNYLVLTCNNICGTLYFDNRNVIGGCS